MFNSAIFFLTVTIFSILVRADDNATTTHIGYSGVLSSLDGGLGGTVTVVDANTLMITSYTLKDASAPALYWWGTNDGVIKDGFRISNEQVTMAATTNTLTIKLDAGKTAADFTTVGLWCERLSANFGQTTLTAAGASTGSTTSGSSSTSSSTSSTGTATTTSSTGKSAAGNLVVSYGGLVAALVAACGFAVWMG